MIIVPGAIDTSDNHDSLYRNVRQWQTHIRQQHLLPLIGIAGTRGKSTVLRLIEAVLDQLRFRITTWTDLGVDIRGRRQPAEIAGWSRAMSHLADGSLDLGLQELDWAMIDAAGLPQDFYPVMIHTGLQDVPEPDAKSTRFEQGQRGTHLCMAATHHDGIIVANADDYFLVDTLEDADAAIILVSSSRETPNLARHLEGGGLGVWIENGNFRIGTNQRSIRIGAVHEFPLTFGGEATFNTKNLMLAMGFLHAVGVDVEIMQQVFRNFRAAWSILPASMNLYHHNDARVIIDQLAPAWILKDVLRVLNPHGKRRQISVVGDLSWIERDEVFEVGRTLGKYNGAIVLHGDNPPELTDLFKQGIATNPYPPLISSLPTERRAINRAFKALRPTDVLVIFTTRDSGSAHRTVRRHLGQQAPVQQE